MRSLKDSNDGVQTRKGKEETAFTIRIGSCTLETIVKSTYSSYNKLIYIDV